MLLGIEELKRVGDVYINPRNFMTRPPKLKSWRDLLSLDEKTFGTYAKIIYNPRRNSL